MSDYLKQLDFHQRNPNAGTPPLGSVHDTIRINAEVAKKKAAGG